MNDGNFYQVDKNVYAGEHPALHGNPMFLVDLKITDLIDLTEGEPNPDYLQALKNQEISRHGFPMADGEVPKYHRAVSEVLDRIDELLAEHRRIYIHCRQGVGRTSVISSLFLTRKYELNGFTAIELLREKWQENPLSAVFNIPETEAQEQFIENFAPLNMKETSHE